MGTTRRRDFQHRRKPYAHRRIYLIVDEEGRIKARRGTSEDYSDKPGHIECDDREVLDAARARPGSVRFQHGKWERTHCVRLSLNTRRIVADGVDTAAVTVGLLPAGVDAVWVKVNEGRFEVPAGGALELVASTPGHRIIKLDDPRFWADPDRLELEVIAVGEVRNDGPTG
jgi:hypothetical protein